ncbi:MAG TPA: efflux RND transporter periplasmic adaptor subunit [Usitatibacteraceae bacterium]|nr:efflux RND transporter periplasmic adaptor subunit [Usitatibacteraceae bacterium]HRA24665.1 efflux RND transporter periplasmic adaptor subunit [Usitatibacteraceae bacterium]
MTAAVVLAALAGALAWWLSREDKAPRAAAKGGPAAVPVTVATVERRDFPVRLRANGTVSALQSVDIRPRITSTVREVHIREGQSVAAGDLLFTLDARAEEAALKKAEAQVAKDRADLANAKRTLERQRQLFAQKFISQSALDAAENQVATLGGQLAVDLAAVEAARVALGDTRIHASFAGRTGAIGVRAGSLVQPNGTVLVTVTQVDPIQVAFTLPERELGTLQRALAAGPVTVEATPDGGRQSFTGRVDFVDNAVDTATGTIRVKARFDNRASRLWPGMFVAVSVAPRTIAQASVVPVQAVQTGPEQRFVFVVGDDRKVSVARVEVAHLDEGLAAVTGVAPGARVVVEGAQNLRPGSTVALPGAAVGKEGGKGGAKAPS